MIGMNAKDAQGALEDLSMIKAAAGEASTGAAADMYRAGAALKNAQRAIAVRSDKLRDVGSQLKALTGEYNDLRAVSNASRKVIDALAKDLASALGLDVDEVRTRAYTAMTKAYDAEVGEMLSTGYLDEDPRKNPQVAARKSRDWYIPTDDAPGL
ncbi:hypothetical protein [Burkholderia sp. Tr-20390]|uniref:hypothetical protein n=1 Tax=Burkholderia sp. Tr-20390 TaxID=2703904 RepID=UPI00197D0ECA|nr:hypothetical protein [Burkholderia sp. Tr-20390]MBN3729523.1 hypothetical protein [Burkholderia sp. Tr-20390]